MTLILSGVQHQEPGDLSHQWLGRREHPRVPPEAVQLAEVAGRGHLDAGLRDPAGQLLALVVQRVVLGDVDECGRKPGQARRPQRRGIRIRPRVLIGKVVPQNQIMVSRLSISWFSGAT